MLPSLPRRAALAACAALLLTAAPVHAQADYPSKPVKIMTGSPPGAPSDITARVFADALQKKLGQPVVVENRPGAGNSLAAGVAANAQPDGYTLVLSPDTVLTVNPHVYTSQNFDPRTDLVSISVLAGFSQMLVCNPATGVKTVKELVDKARGGQLTYASGGPGVPGHLAAEMFLQAAGVKMQHVPYRGPAPGTMAVLSGEVNCGFLATPTLIPHVKAGKLSALAVSSATPSALAPQVPTLEQAMGKDDLDVTFRLVLQAPKGTPAPVLAKLEQAAGEIMRDPQIRAKLQASDVIPIGSTAAQARSTMQAEMQRWAPLVKGLGLKAN